MSPGTGEELKLLSGAVAKRPRAKQVVRTPFCASSTRADEPSRPAWPLRGRQRGRYPPPSLPAFHRSTRTRCASFCRRLLLQVYLAEVVEAGAGQPQLLGTPADVLHGRILVGWGRMSIIGHKVLVPILEQREEPPQPVRVKSSHDMVWSYSGGSGCWRQGRGKYYCCPGVGAGARSRAETGGGRLTCMHFELSERQGGLDAGTWTGPGAGMGMATVAGTGPRAGAAGGAAAYRNPGREREWWSSCGKPPACGARVPRCLFSFWAALARLQSCMPFDEVSMCTPHGLES